MNIDDIIEKCWNDSTTEGSLCHKAEKELIALRRRVAELEAALTDLETDGEIEAQSIVTPNNCRHCQRAAEKMREAAAETVQNELDWLRDEYDKRFAYGQRIMASIRALPLPACDGCNPLAPSQHDADMLEAWHERL